MCVKQKAGDREKTPQKEGLMRAERAGFEPAVRVNAHTLSKRAPSAARPPLQMSRNQYIMRERNQSDFSSSSEDSSDTSSSGSASSASAVSSEGTSS